MVDLIGAVPHTAEQLNARMAGVYSFLSRAQGKREMFLLAGKQIERSAREGKN